MLGAETNMGAASDTKPRFLRHPAPLQPLSLRHKLRSTYFFPSHSSWTVRYSIPDGMTFSVPVQTVPDAHPASFSMVTGLFTVGRDGSVGIATRYGLDGPGIESRWRRDFPHPSRPALGPNQPPVQWVPGLSRR